MYENVFGNWAVRSFKCVFFANYILLPLLLMDFHPAGSVVTGTRGLLDTTYLSSIQQTLPPTHPHDRGALRWIKLRRVERSEHTTVYKRTHGQRHHAKEQLFRWTPSQAALTGESMYRDRRDRQGSCVTSLPLCCSLLQRNVPNKQLYRWSKMVMRKYSLNSNAVGNCKSNSKTQK